MRKKKILIVHHGALGDVVATFPALTTLRRSFGNITALFQGQIGTLAAWLAVVDRWFSLDSAAFVPLYSGSASRNLMRELRSFDAAVLFSRSRDLLLTVKRHVRGNVHLVPPRPDTGQNVRVAQHVLSSLSGHGLIAGGLDCDSIRPPRRRLENSGRHRDPLRILMHPGSGSIKKNWPVENFLRTALILESDGWRPEFVLGPAELDLAETLAARGFANARLHRPDGLIALAVLLESVAGFIGNDSGVSHLAAFMGVPSVVVFGPSDPGRWTPAGPAVTVIRPELQCAPCFENNVRDCETLECLHKTLPEEVAGAFGARMR